MNTWCAASGSILPPVILSLAAGLAGLLIVWSCHELGHVLAAKVFRLKLARYYFGFDDADNPLNFAARPVWQRMIVILSGSLFSLMAAVLFAALAYQSGVDYTPCILGGTSPGGPAWVQGLNAGDKILQPSRDGEPSEHLRFDWELRQAVAANGADRPMEILVRRRDSNDEQWIQLQPTFQSAADDFPIIGVSPPSTTVLAALPDSVAVEEGDNRKSLQVGDEIVAVDGHELPRDSRTGTILAHDFEATIAQRLTEPVELTVLRRVAEAPVDEATRRSQTVRVILPPKPMRVLGLAMEAGPIAAIRQGSSGEAAGFAVGDRLLTINGEPIGDPVTVTQRMIPLAGQEVEVAVQREQFEQPVVLRVTPELPTTAGLAGGRNSPLPLTAIGVALPLTNVVQAVAPDGPAAREGLREGDEILRVQFFTRDVETDERNRSLLGYQYDEPLEMGDELTDWSFVHGLLQLAAPGTEVELTIQREDVQEVVVLVPEEAENHYTSLRGFRWSPTQNVHTADSVPEAFSLGFRTTREIALQHFETAWMVVTGSIKTSNLVGPLGISAVAGNEASVGVGRMLLFWALLSVTFAFVSLLPMPGLDGGHLLYLAIEAIRGKPLPRGFQLNTIMICLLGSLFVLRIFSLPCVSQLFRLIQLLRRKREIPIVRASLADDPQ